MTVNIKSESRFKTVSNLSIFWIVRNSKYLSKISLAIKNDLRWHGSSRLPWRGANLSPLRGVCVCVNSALSSAPCEFNIETSAIARNRKEGQGTGRVWDEEGSANGRVRRATTITIMPGTRSIEPAHRVGSVSHFIGIYLPGPTARMRAASCIGYLLNCVRLRPRVRQTDYRDCLAQEMRRYRFRHVRDEKRITLFIDAI